MKGYLNSMDDHIPPVLTVEPNLSFWDKHRFSLLLLLALIVAIVLTVVSMVLYNVSGAAQLDLSRPGYQSISNQVDTESKIETYSSSGSVNKETIQEFMSLYDKQAEKAKAVDAFNGDPLNPEVLFQSDSNATQ